MEKSKSRTAITIDPDLWERAKKYCEEHSTHGNKMSFSSLIEKSLEFYLEHMTKLEDFMKTLPERDN